MVLFILLLCIVLVPLLLIFFNVYTSIGWLVLPILAVVSAFLAYNDFNVKCEDARLCKRTYESSRRILGGAMGDCVIIAILNQIFGVDLKLAELFQISPKIPALVWDLLALILCGILLSLTVNKYRKYSVKVLEQAKRNRKELINKSGRVAMVAAGGTAKAVGTIAKGMEEAKKNSLVHKVATTVAEGTADAMVEDIQENMRDKREDRRLDRQERREDKMLNRQESREERMLDRQEARDIRTAKRQERQAYANYDIAKRQRAIENKQTTAALLNTAANVTNAKAFSKLQDSQLLNAAVKLGINISGKSIEEVAESVLACASEVQLAELPDEVDNVTKAKMLLLGGV